MKKLSKSLLASALVAAGITGMSTAHAVEWKLGGELAVELTDSDASDDLDLDVTTTDLELTISETFGEIEVEGFIAYEKGDDEEDEPALVEDGAGITVSGAFGSVFVGDDGTDISSGDMTDVLYNNSELFTLDPTEHVIDYGLPLGDDFALNIFVDITDEDDDTDAEQEDIDAFGAYGSYSVSGLTFALGYTVIEEDGALGVTEIDEVEYTDQDDILDVFVGYEGGPIAAGLGYQTSEIQDEDFEVVSAYLTYTVGPVAITPYYEEREFSVGSTSLDNDVIALNVTYNFSDNFYAFFEAADFDSDDSDNSEIGLVLTF